MPPTTFLCDHCHEERPLAGSEDLVIERWCEECVDTFDLPRED
jgi:hypothetical protein